MECWKKLRKLGQGSFGTVFQACKDSSSFSSSSIMAAVKSAECTLRNPITSLKEEAKFLDKLNGTPNVVQCFGEDISIEDNGKVVHNLLLELALGSLYDMIKITKKCGKPMTETYVACYASMLLKGLVAIHSKGIVHCDLKPGNILLFPVHGTELGILKIADFGRARWVWEEEEEQVADGTSYSRTTLNYASPESVSYGLHGTCTDIWSFGCIVAEMLTGKRVWDSRDEEELIHMILYDGFYRPHGLSDNGADFLSKCLDRDPAQRWLASDLLKHPFIIDNLKIISETPGYDMSILDRNSSTQKNPFGECGWVSTRHLFSKWMVEALQKQERDRKRQKRRELRFQPYTAQQSRQAFQFLVEQHQGITLCNTFLVREPKHGSNFHQV